MINYIIQIILFQVLFLAVYDLFLSKETFFTKNRFYLIATAVLSFVLPLVKITSLQEVVPKEYTVLLPEVVLSPEKVIEKSSWYENINYLQLLFWIGVAVFLVVFIIKLIKIIQLIFSNEIHLEKDYKLVLLPKNSKAFSFFNYIFLGREIPKEKQEKIIQHELVHSTQKHSLDLLFFELLKIVMWFNPMIYLYQNRIALVHEFISDEVVTKSAEKTTYINSLLSEIFQVEQISFINQFYKQSLIKKRIIMMTKNKSKQIKQLKYLLLVPVLASMVLYVSCTAENNNIEENTKEELKVDAIKNKELEEIIEVVEDLSEKNYSKGEILEEVKNMLQRNKENSYNQTKKEINVIKNTQEELPFALIDKAPMFPNSTSSTKEEFAKLMQQHIQKNFNTKIADNLGLVSGKKRIFIKFKIDDSGNIINTEARAPHAKLKEEAIRLVKKLPKFKPAEHNGQKVSAAYVLPIVFNVQ